MALQQITLDNPSGTRVTVADVTTKINENTTETEQRLTAAQSAADAAGTSAGGKYTKPSGGIPAADLSAAAQASLGKADSAYQIPPGGIPQSDMTTAVQILLGLANTAYQKPGSGIPSSDFSAAVQAVLALASTGYQKPISGIPATDLASAVQSQLTAGASAYQKPGSGIPSTDMSATVTAALNLASSSVQQNPAGVTWVQSILANYLYVDPTVPGALVAAVTAGGAVYMKPFTTYPITTGLNLNSFNTDLIGVGSKIDASAVTGVALTVDYVSGASSGPDLRVSKSRTITGFELAGPGRTVSGSKGIFFNSTGGKTNAPHPSVHGIFVHDFETGIGGRDQFYLVGMSSMHVYLCVYGLWQEGGDDSGEVCYVSDSVFDLNYCNLRFDDNSSEFVFIGCGFDYSRQLLVSMGSCRITFLACHVENRGAQLSTDVGNYIVDGSGSDTRAALQAIDPTVDGARFMWTCTSTQTAAAITINAGGSGNIAVKTTALANPSVVSGQTYELVRSVANSCYILQDTRSGKNIPIATNVSGTTSITCDAFTTRDVFIDVDGDGAIINFVGGTLDINSSGGAGPYAYRRLVKVRHAGSQVLFSNMYCTNVANRVDMFWDGPGRVRCGFITRAGSDPGNCLRWAPGSRNNAFRNTDLTYTAIDQTTGNKTYASPIAIAAPTNPNGIAIAAGALSSYQDWWIYMGRGEIQPNARYSDASNYIASRDSGTQPGLSTTGNVTISIVQPTVGNPSIASGGWSISGEVLTVTGTITGGNIVPEMKLAGTGIPVDGSGTTAPRILGQMTGPVLTFTGTLSGATGGTLTSAWTGTTGTYTVNFSDGSSRTATLTNSSTAVTWTGGTVTASATASILLSSTNAGGPGMYLIDTSALSISSGASTLTLSISNAIALNKYNTETSGYLSRARVATAVFAEPDRRATGKFLFMVESTGGMAGGSVTVTSQWARIYKDSNGLPVIAEQFAQIDFNSFTLSSTTKDVWIDMRLRSYGAQSDAPTGANAIVFQFSMDSNGTPGRILVARPRCSLLG